MKKAELKDELRPEYDLSEVQIIRTENREVVEGIAVPLTKDGFKH